MTDQRFKYYTGYEVDNEPSDDDDDLPCNTITAKNQDQSESSADEFDEPIREYVEKAMSQANAKKPSSTVSAASNAFADEMEDELDQIYHNFISRGTFELPISTQKSEEKKKVVLNDKDEADSDDEDDPPVVVNKEDQEKINDDLLYDPEEEEEDEKWMANQRLKSQGITTTDKPTASSLGPTDAVLNCPGCMVLICHDCQRHETNRNQYRAMFVFNCTIDENRLAATPKSSKKSAQQKKSSNKRFKTDEPEPADQSANANEILRPVLCSECGTELGVYEPADELYHFANVLASH